MIEIIPAIDIIGGKCVRLRQGNYTEKKIYNENPLEVALSFEDAGIQRLHMVDLEGAKSSRVVNLNILESVASKTKLIIDFGGGIKTDEDIEKVFNCGAYMVTVGSIAVSNPGLLYSWIKKYGSEKIILGADVRGTKIAISGWFDTTDSDIFEFIAGKKRAGIQKVLCTDISRDGMLKGPAIDLYKDLRQHFNDLYIIASGGVTSTDDISELEMNRIDAAIVGKALYEHRITLEELKRFIIT